MSVMTAERAQQIIDSLPKYEPPTEMEKWMYKTMQVGYRSVDQMPQYKQDRLAQCIDWITNKYGNVQIFLCMSQVDGCPVDEKTTVEQFLAKKAHGKAKFSDWDFIVPAIGTWNIIEQIAPLIKVDLFGEHHNSVRRLLVNG